MELLFGEFPFWMSQEVDGSKVRISGLKKPTDPFISRWNCPWKITNHWSIHKPRPGHPKNSTYMAVSENNGFSPQIIHLLIGFSMIFTIHFGGFPPIFGNTNIYYLETEPPSSSENFPPFLSYRSINSIGILMVDQLVTRMLPVWYMYLHKPWILSQM